jgi:hypothetical protein
MAGRPARRARQAAKNNPLVGFDLPDVKPPMSEVAEQARMMFAPGAKERYERALKAMPERLVIGAQSKHQPRSSFVKPEMPYEAVYYGAEDRPDVVEDLPGGKGRRLPRWDQNRESIYSPFAALHNVGERVFGSFDSSGFSDNREIAFMALLNEEIDDIVSTAQRKYGQDLITGLVDTAAGRNGALRVWSADTFGDLFAKHLFPDKNGKTGRIGYLVENAPAEFEEEVEKIHFLLSELLPRARKYFYSEDQEAARGVDDYAAYGEDYGATDRLKNEFVRAFKQWIKDPRNKPHPMSLAVPPPEPKKKSRLGGTSSAKSNPLVSFINRSKLTPRETFEPLALFSHPKAHEIFAAKYEKIPTNVMVYYGPLAGPYDEGGISMDDLNKLAVRHKVTMLVVREGRREGDEPWYKNRQDITRFTAFNLLHRWADGYFDTLSWMRSSLKHCIDHGIDPAECGWTADEILAWNVLKKLNDRRFEQYLGLSVDTKAGRLKRIVDASQAIADLFAKYMLTGKVALKLQYQGRPDVDNYLDSAAKAIEVVLPVMKKEFDKPGASNVGIGDNELD